jgi:CTP-dependent riboflavin kinase
MKETTQEQIINEYQKSIDSINGSVVQAYKTLKSLKDNTYIEKSLPKMGILIDIKETWQKELLENLYDSEDLALLRHQFDEDYELELLVRRKHKSNK